MHTLYQSTATYVLIILIAAVASIGFVSQPSIAHATGNQCSGTQKIDSLGNDGDSTRYDDLYFLVDNNHLEFSSFSVSGSSISITVTNNTGCSYPLGLGAYKMFDNQLGNQKLHDRTNRTVGPQSSITLAVDTAQCMTQIDLYSGDAPTEQFDDNRYASRLIGYTFVGNDKDNPQENDIFHGGPHDDFPNDDDDGYQDAAGNFCPADQPKELTVSCSVDPSNPRVGDTVSWKASAGGGTGEFTYSWSGDVSGNTRTIDKQYQTSGSKQATVTVTSGDQTASRTCSVTVRTQPPADLTGSCSVSPNRPEVGETVNWSASAEGGIGEFAYSWSGDVNADTKTASKSFTTGGRKQATVTITSGNQSIQRSCSVRVQEQEEEEDQPLRGSCRVSPTRADTDEEVIWTADIRGGNPPYEYDWDLEGSSDESDRRRIRTEYSRSGSYDGDLKVTDKDGRRIFRSCGDVRIRSEDDEKDDFSVACQPDQASYLVGERVTFRADIRGQVEENDVDFDWDQINNSGYNFRDRGRKATVQYTETGRKSVRVTAESDSETESDVCRVSIRKAGDTKGVQLDDVPYTGPEDNAKTFGFVGGLSLVSLVAGWLMLQRRKLHSVPVGIPDDFR